MYNVCDCCPHSRAAACNPAGVVPTLYFVPESPLFTEGADATACASLPVSRKLLGLEHNVTQSATWTSTVRRNGVLGESAIQRVGNAGKLQLQDSWLSEVSMGLQEHTGGDVLQTYSP